MTSANDAMTVLSDVGAVLHGHFQYTSGRHGGVYVEKFRLLEDPVATSRLCRQIADHFSDSDVEVVVGPTTGGVILAFETGRQIGVHDYFAERSADGDGRTFQRGFAFRPGQRTLIVDDILTTGGSVRDTMDAVRAAGGEPVGVGVVVDRTNGRTDFGVPFFACMTLDIETFPPDDCPLCRDGVDLAAT